MFFTYDQNNSGGSFIRNEHVTKYVIIEAESASQADEKAEIIGLYFDGEDDCSCCGPRWWNAYEERGDLTPQIYGEAPENTSMRTLGEPFPYAYVYYANGTKVSYTS